MVPMRIIFLTLFLCSPVFGQDFSALFSPETPLTTAEFENMYLPEKNIDRPGKESHVFFQSIDVNQRIFQKESMSVAVGARYQKLDLSGAGVLRDYYNQQGSVSFKKNFEEGKFWLINGGFGSASDRPFKNSRDNTISSNLIYKFNEKWIGVVNYSNNRTFLNNIPLPGVFYIASAERHKTLIIGFPVIFWTNPLSDNFSFRYIGFMPWTHRFRVYYEKFGFVRPYAGVEQQPQTFFRHDREERFDRFFWFERRITTGAEGILTKSLRYDLGGGYAFDRQFFEARNFSEKKEFLINLENAWFVSLHLRLKF